MREGLKGKSRNVVVCRIETRHALSVPRNLKCSPVQHFREELDRKARPDVGA